MKSFYIQCHSWLLFESDEATLAEVNLDLQTLIIVRNIFMEWFGRDKIEALSPLSVLRSLQKYPQCFRNTGLVFLSANRNFPPQIIFQFAHELCHLMIPQEVPQKFRWFEETLCHLASMSALRLVATGEFGFAKESGSRFLTYANEVLNDNMSIPEGLPLSCFIQSNLAALENSPYMRSVNGAMAEYLYPAATLDFWKRVPYLCEIPKDASFEDGIRLFVSGLPDTERTNLLSILLGTR